MHVLAQALAAQGYAVAALDLRGHGGSGVRGQAAYVGQLEDDLKDFMRALPYTGPQTLIGFSSGGGFALRFAGSQRQGLFDRYVLLSPYLHPQAPTSRPGDGGWVSVGLPRLVALALQPPGHRALERSRGAALCHRRQGARLADPGLLVYPGAEHAPA